MKHARDIARKYKGNAITLYFCRIAHYEACTTAVQVQLGLVIVCVLVGAPVSVVTVISNAVLNFVPCDTFECAAMLHPKWTSHNFQTTLRNRHQVAESQTAEPLVRQLSPTKPVVSSNEWVVESSLPQLPRCYRRVVQNITHARTHTPSQLIQHLRRPRRNPP